MYIKQSTTILRTLMTNYQAISDMVPGGHSKIAIRVEKLSSSKWTKCPGLRGAFCLTIYVYIIYLQNDEY